MISKTQKPLRKLSDSAPNASGSILLMGDSFFGTRQTNAISIQQKSLFSHSFAFGRKAGLCYNIPMDKLLALDCCLRGNDSRTLRIGKAFLEEAKNRYDIALLKLDELPISPKRSDYFQRGDDALSLKLSRQFASAQRIVLIAPCYEMNVPALLKTYFERISIAGITFPDGESKGGCEAKKMLLITTRGFDFDDGSELDAASAELKALCWLWKIDSFAVLSAQGLDETSEQESERRVASAMKRAQELAHSF